MTVRSLWPLLGYEPPKGVRRRTEKLNRWRRVLDRDPNLWEWLRSKKGLRAPRRWPRRIENALRKSGVYVSPEAFAAACFPGRLGIATKYTEWRGMAELCAAAHGWPLEREEVREALYAVDALSQHVPFVVYACRPDFKNIPLPSSGESIMKRISERNEFLLDPLGRDAHERRHAIDENLWTAEALKHVPRLEWIPCTKAVPTERGMVEAGVGGWVPSASRPHGAVP